MYQVFLQGAVGRGAAVFVTAQHEREGCLLVLLQDSSRGCELPAYPLPGRTAVLCDHMDGWMVLCPSSAPHSSPWWALPSVDHSETALNPNLTAPLPFWCSQGDFAATTRTSHPTASSEGFDLHDGDSTAAPCLSSLLSSCSHTLSEHCMCLTSEHHVSAGDGGVSTSGWLPCRANSPAVALEMV